MKLVRLVSEIFSNYLTKRYKIIIGKKTEVKKQFC